VAHEAEIGVVVDLFGSGLHRRLSWAPPKQR
jgi:hypothetical protein